MMGILWILNFEYPRGWRFRWGNHGTCVVLHWKTSFTDSRHWLKFTEVTAWQVPYFRSPTTLCLVVVYPLRGTQSVTEIWRLTSWILLRGPSLSVERYFFRYSFTFLSHQLWRTSLSRNIGRLFHGPWRYLAARTGQPTPSTMLLFMLQ